VGHGDNTELWSLDDGHCRVVSLPDSSCPGDLGTAVWILSHLTYPLAWVGDTFRIRSNGEGYADECFLRTSEVVDMSVGGLYLSYRVNIENKFQ